MRIEVMIDVKTILGEGPLWDVDEQRLYFIDSFGCNVFRCTADGREVRAWDVPAKIGSMALRRQGGAVVSLANGFHFLDFKTGDCQLIVDPESDKPANRINDGKVDKRGRFVAGSMDTMEDGPNGALYRLDADLSAHRLVDGLVCPNALCWSPDSRTMYHADSARRTVWAWDFEPDAGTIANRRTFLEVPASDGAPDGATVDAEGFVWLAHWGGWRLTRLDPGGRIERVIRLPVQQPTCPAFGGPDLDVLYVTSASITLTAEARVRQPWAGGILALDPGVRGLCEARFRG